MPIFRKPNELSFFDRGPGPAAYSLPGLTGRPGHDVSHLIEPQYSFGLKLPSSLVPRHYVSPGPGTYSFPERCTRFGKSCSPAFTMRDKPALPKSTVTPAPNYYRTTKSNVFKVRVPAFTFPAKRPVRDLKIKIAPNAYAVPTMIGPFLPCGLSAQAATLKGNRKSNKLPMVNDQLFDLSKSQSGPAFTMRIKPEPFKPFNRVGPTTYKPERAKIFPRAPRWHMGIRYNEFTGIFSTPCENFDYGSLKDPIVY